MRIKPDQLPITAYIVSVFFKNNQNNMDIKQRKVKSMINRQPQGYITIQGYK